MCVQGEDEGSTTDNVRVKHNNHQIRHFISFLFACQTGGGRQSVKSGGIIAAVKFFFCVYAVVLPPLLSTSSSSETEAGSGVLTRHRKKLKPPLLLAVFCCLYLHLVNLLVGFCFYDATRSRQIGRTDILPDRRIDGRTDTIMSQ